MRAAHVAWPVAGALLLVAEASRAEPGSGTLDDPVVVDAFPYAIAASTAGAPSDAIDAYSCASSLDESGPEVVYVFSLGAPAKVTAWVEGDGGGVDIDVHLLDDAVLDGALASGCAARGNVVAEADMAAGVHYAVVDSFDGDAQAGPYVLHLEAIGDAWTDRVLAEGVRWRARRFADLSGPQVAHELVVDTTVAGVEIRAIAASGCQTVPAIGEAEGALAGVNGGYFNMVSGCPPVSLLKESGTVIATGGMTRGAFGLSSSQVPLVELVPAGDEWAAAYEAHGGGPILVVNSVANQGSSAWAAEGFTNASFNGPNPRTLAGFDAAGAAHLATVDGRRTTSAGLSLDDWAAYAASELALTDAVNLDGGGSTTLWIAGATPNGVVNYPSGGGEESADHGSLRAVSGGFFVFAPPYDHPPRFQTEPPLSARVGDAYEYDADAIDLDVEDVVTFSLELAPDGMSVDADSGFVSFAPTVDSPPSAEVVLRASDDRGASTDQSYTLDIEGGLGAGGQGGGTSSGGAGGTGAAPVGAVPSSGDDEGCTCTTAGTGTAAGGPAWLGLVGLLALGRRCRRAPPKA